MVGAPCKVPSVDILPAAIGKDSYGLSVCFAEMASVGSSYNRSNNKLSATFQMSRQQGLRLHS